MRCRAAGLVETKYDGRNAYCKNYQGILSGNDNGGVYILTHSSSGRLFTKNLYVFSPEVVDTTMSIPSCMSKNATLYVALLTWN